MDNAKCFSLGHLGDSIYRGGEHWGGIGLGENQDFGLRYFAFEMLTRQHVGMWFGAFPGAFGLGRAQPQRRGTSP